MDSDDNAEMGAEIGGEIGPSGYDFQSETAEQAAERRLAEDEDLRESLVVCPGWRRTGFH